MRHAIGQPVRDIGPDTQSSHHFRQRVWHRSRQRRGRLWGPGWRALAVVLLVGQAGCLSHEYRVSREELVRMAETPPESRVQHVRVLQEIGVRRGPALDPTAAPPPPPPPGAPVYTDRGVVQDDHWHTHVMIGGVIHSGGGPRGGGRVGPPPPRTAAVAGPVGPRAQLAGPVGTQVAPPSTGVPAPQPSTTGKTPGVRSGSGGKDDLMVYAVVAIVVASLAAVGAGLTEGMRFDGDVAVVPQQLIYLQDGQGGERPVPIASLTTADLTGAERAVLRDDEGFGLMRLERAPLNRRGFAFKVDVGSVETVVAGNKPLGVSSHVQFGYFPFQRFGLLAGLDLAGAGGEDAFSRHALALEAQVFPINFWRIHLGGSVHAGSAVTDQDTANTNKVWGVPSVGAGAILEVALTTRLALTARFDWTALRSAPDNWSSARSLSAGLAIY
jgi:hypothetical protein